MLITYDKTVTENVDLLMLLKTINSLTNIKPPYMMVIANNQKNFK